MFFDLWKHQPSIVFKTVFSPRSPYTLCQSSVPSIVISSLMPLSLCLYLNTLVFLNILSLVSSSSSFSHTCLHLLPSKLTCQPKCLLLTSFPLFYWWHHHLPSVPDLNSQELQILLMSSSICHQTSLILPPTQLMNPSIQLPSSFSGFS